MSDPAWLNVNKSEEAVTLDMPALCAEFEPKQLSPIDEYYDSSKALLLKSTAPEVAGDAWMLRLLVLGQVSITETYFRRILSRLISICPVAYQAASTETVALAAVPYYGSELGYGLLEHHSLSGAREIRSRTEKVAAVSIPNNSSISAALDEFDHICQLRHAAVHSAGELSARNAWLVGLGSARSTLNITPLGFQNVVAICHNAVRAYNKHMFARTLDKWIGAGLLSGVWTEDSRLFRPLYKLFYSSHDSVGYKTAFNAYRRLRASALT